MATRRASQRAATLLLAVPCAVLLAAYAWLALAHGRFDLGAVVVHEDGRRTLAQTIGYWRHFLREVPVVALSALCIAAAWFTYGPSVAPAPARRWAGAAAALLVGIAFVLTAAEAGVRVAVWELGQAYARDGTWEYGAHWRGHLLSTLALGAAAAVAASALGRALDGAWPAPRRAARRRWLGGAGAAAAALTLLWPPGLAPFADARDVGHQLRELATHLPTTLPIGLAALLLAVGRGRAATPAGGPAPPRDVRAAAVALAVVTAYLAGAAVLLGAAGAARPGAALPALVAAHVFEHSLDYLLAALLCLWLAGTRAPRG